MTRALLTAILLTLFSQTACADVVFYCSSGQMVGIEKDKFDRLSSEKFKLALLGDETINDFKTIVFRGGILDSYSFEVHYAADENWWQAGSEKSTFVFRNSWLYGSISNGENIISFSSKCDKF